MTTHKIVWQIFFFLIHYFFFFVGFILGNKDNIHVDNDSNFVEGTVRVSKKCSEHRNYEFVFIHIPKAGGSTFEAMYQQTKKFNQVNPYRRSVGREIKASITPLHHSFEGLSKKYQCLNDDNSPHPVCKEIAQKCLVWMTVLRDPAGRLVSDFYHTANRREQNHHFACDHKTPPNIANSVNIDEFMHSDPVILKNKCSKDFQKTFNLFTGVDGRKATEEDVRIAKKRIKQMHFVGIMERMDETMQLFSYTFDLDLLRYFPTFNYNGYKHTISNQTIAAIKKYSEIDYELYEFAKTIFEERYQKMVAELHSEGKKATSFKCDRSATMCWNINKSKNLLHPYKTFQPCPVEEVEKITKNKKFPHYIFCSPSNGCERNATYSII